MKPWALLSRMWVVGAIAAAALILAPGSVAMAQQEPGRSTVGGTGPIHNELDEETRAAVAKGLAWLAANVNQQGIIRNEGGDSAAIVALAGLAFLADGNMPNDGRYGRESALILDFILKCCQETGLIAAPGYSQPMYGHGFATLFLAEAYGMSPRPDLGEKLRNAVRLIVRTQQESTGGWRYQPVPNDADISVTICQIMALRAARNAGIKVPNRTIDLAIRYVQRSQTADGGFMYTLSGGGSAFPRSAAGVACLYYMRTGDVFGEEIKRGIAYLRQRIPGSGRPDSEGHFYYGNYYATQAMFMYGGEAWEAYWPAIRKKLLADQRPDGGWTGETGPVYATSMALIILQVPNRLLPILQK